MNLRLSQNFSFWESLIFIRFCAEAQQTAGGIGQDVYFSPGFLFRIKAK
jgi:hypothetical protein